MTDRTTDGEALRTMRRALVCTLAVPALILAGCSGSDSPETPTTPVASTPAPAPEPEDAGETEAPEDSEEATEAAPADDDTATSGPDAAATTAVPADEVEGGEEGQAAADVAKAFYVAMLDKDAHADVCDYLLSFSDPEKPMKDHESDYETCQELLPEVLGAELTADGGDEELAGIISAMQIRGADVQGDTAVVDGDNYSDLFAETIGQAPITLRKVGDDWYIDLDHSFQTAS